MNITIKTLPHGQQLYDTVGDWRFDTEGNLEIRVSEMGDWRYEALVGIHEAIEALLCKDRGITTEAVDAFDNECLALRPDDRSEPGDNPAAPYRKEHFFATSVERLLAAELGVLWFEYDETVLAL